MFVALLSILSVVGHLPTYKYFVMHEDYQEVEIHEDIVQECFDYGKNTVQQFLDEFKGYSPTVLVHAWKRTNEKGDFYACEVFRQRLRYLITINIPNPEKPERKYIHSVRILNGETEGGAHWFHPTDEFTDFVMETVNEKFGDDVKLRNVAVFKTIMKGKTIAQMVLDVENDLERMLLDITLIKPFGEENFNIEEIKRIY